MVAYILATTVLFGGLNGGVRPCNTLPVGRVHSLMMRAFVCARCKGTSCVSRECWAVRVCLPDWSLRNGEDRISSTDMLQQCHPAAASAVPEPAGACNGLQNVVVFAMQRGLRNSDAQQCRTHAVSMHARPANHAAVLAEGHQPRECTGVGNMQNMHAKCTCMHNMHAGHE